MCSLDLAYNLCLYFSPCRALVRPFYCTPTLWSRLTIHSLPGDFYELAVFAQAHVMRGAPGAHGYMGTRIGGPPRPALPALVDAVRYLPAAVGVSEPLQQSLCLVTGLFPGAVVL